jgi:8-oxo-dGTP diphosphatase
MKHIDAAIAIVSRDGKILITQRKSEDTFGDYWEFPGGKCERGETLHQALARELHEELRITAEPRHAFSPITHDYRTAVVRLHPFLCTLTAGEPQLIECQACEWIEPHQLRSYRFPPANEGLIEAVISHLSTDPTPRPRRSQG